MNLIGIGGHRYVFDLGNGAVKKVPKQKTYKYGVLQNEVEYFMYKEYFKEYPFLCRVICIEGDNLIMDKVDTLSKFLKGDKIDFKGFGLDIKLLDDFINRFNYIPYDIYNSAHWGIDAEGDLKLVDYGINNIFIKNIN